MNDVMAQWAERLPPFLLLPAVQWSLLLALAAAAGQWVQNHLGLPRLIGYSVIGAAAGLGGLLDTAWPLQGTGLYLLQLGVALVLFEAGGRISLGWFRHNPMVLVQSLAEALLTYAFVSCTLQWLAVAPRVAEALAVIAVVGSPAVLSRVRQDAHASGPVTERAQALTTLGTLYALVLVNARTQVMHLPRETLLDTLLPIAASLGVAVAVGLCLAATLRLALRFMNPASENTAVFIISLLAAATALAAYWGASAPLSALLGGLFLTRLHPRPWAAQRQLGTAASALVMFNFVLVAVVAAQAPWNPAVAGLVLGLLGARALAKVLGVGLANPGSGLRWSQGLWTSLAMWPMSSVALLLVADFVQVSPSLGPDIAAIGLPAVLLMEVVGAVVATLALRQARECGRAA